MAMLSQGSTAQATRSRVYGADGPAYLRMGGAVILYALAAAGWIAYETSQRGQDEGDFFKALWDPRAGLVPWAQTPNDWALITAALVAGALALGRRRVARGALMLLAVVLIGLSLRELVGLAVSDGYRSMFDQLDYGTWLIVFRVAGLIVGTGVLIEMVRAGRLAGGPQPIGAPHAGYGAPNAGYGTPYAAPHDATPGGHGPAGYGPPIPGYRPATTRPGFIAAGVSLLLCGAAAFGWLVYRLTRSEVYLVGGTYGGNTSAEDFFRNVVDASHGPSIPYTFHTIAMVMAPLLVGIFLLRGFAAARGAALTLAFISLYLDVRGLVPVFADGQFDAYFDSTVGTLALLTTFLTVPLMIVAVVTLLRTPEE
ncbi:hypothetical protein AB0O76_09840 [Streptomyces sp. NPDC086554]|uniref:hypothetical protein n=1 Tax=Streptomyces sp. NPDC086554 TaxID=3154864 RepID=UPI00341BFE5D